MKNKGILKLAVVILNSYRKQFAEYAEYRRDMAKQGYGPEHCIHGTCLWTDYDNICGPCEDGLGYWDYETFARMALGEAEKAFTEAGKRTAAVATLAGMGAPIVSADFGEWIVAPMTRWTE